MGNSCSLIPFFMSNINGTDELVWGSWISWSCNWVEIIKEEDYQSIFYPTPIKASYVLQQHPSYNQIIIHNNIINIDDNKVVVSSCLEGEEELVPGTLYRLIRTRKQISTDQLVIIAADKQQQEQPLILVKQQQQQQLLQKDDEEVIKLGSSTLRVRVVLSKQELSKLLAAADCGLTISTTSNDLIGHDFNLEEVIIGKLQYLAGGAAAGKVEEEDHDQLISSGYSTSTTAHDQRWIPELETIPEDIGEAS